MRRIIRLILTTLGIISCLAFEALALYSYYTIPDSYLHDPSSTLIPIPWFTAGHACCIITFGTPFIIMLLLFSNYRDNRK